MDAEFQAAYKQLNPEQREAVDNIEGPLLVVAGPGTGKTQLLSLRVANIIRKTDTDPSAILCLTFTNFAANNMRERLQALIGTGAQQVRVQTFHSFAADIMAQNPDYFWQGARLSVAPDTVQLDILQTILAELPLDNPLASRFAGQFTALPDMQQALKLSKEAGLTPAKLAAMIEVNVAYLGIIEPSLVELFEPVLSVKKLPVLLDSVEALPNQPIDQEITPLVSLSTVLKESLRKAVESDLASGKATETGKWKRRWLQMVEGKRGLYDERRRNEWWTAFAQVYEIYRQRLHGRGYYDYSDMLVEVISQLEQQPELLASVQEKFLYILIDEFQDTNAAQLRLAHLVATHPDHEQAPNLMAVGDDDQTIFAFNGAELNNMLAFRRTYPATKLVLLTKNYRSTQAILDTAQAIISQATERIVNREPELTKKLLAMTPPDKGEIVHIQYPTRAHQFTALAQRIEELWRSQQGGKLAVLARNHSSLKELSGLLNKLRVPIRYEQQNDILQEEAIIQIGLLARIVQAIADGEQPVVNACLAKLLRHPVWQVPPQALWELALSNQRQADWLKALLENKSAHLVALGNWLCWLASEASHQPLAVIIEYMLGLTASLHLTSPLREYFLQLRTVDKAYLQAVSGIHVLLGLVDEFSARGEASLADFVRFIDLHEELGRPIVDQSWFVSGEHAVQLMTVHKAKGLEFDTVFLVDAIADLWQPRRIGRKPPANLPLQPYGEEYDDYVRLLYVAATRAKRSFIVSSYTSNDGGEEVLATPLIASALRIEPVEGEALDDPIQILETAISWPRLENAQEQALLKERLENYALSATGLCQFLDVASGGPQYFFARSLLGVPEALTPRQGYGNAIHSALQTAQRLVRQDSFSLRAVQKAYLESLQKQALPVHDIERYGQFGKDVLSKLFNGLGLELPKNGQAEVKFGPLTVGDARLRGTLDHILEENGYLTITDYKTGNPITSFHTRDLTKQLKVWRHRLQLTFYALLAHNERHASTIITRLAFVEAESPKQLFLAFTPSQEELQQLEQLVQAVWRHIMALDFPDISRYSKDMAGIEAFTADLLSGETKKAA